MQKSDLSHAQPGDTYRGPDGQLWNVDHVGEHFVALHAEGSKDTTPHLVSPDDRAWHGFRKVERKEAAESEQA